MSFGESEALFSAIEVGDQATVMRIMASNPRGIRFNEARQVLQLFDCVGAVRDQIEIPESVAALLN
jgi:hypothetical protein